MYVYFLLYRRLPSYDTLDSFKIRTVLLLITFLLI